MPLLKYVAKNIFTVNAVGCQGKVLIPGLNRCTQAELDAMQKHPIFKSFVNEGKIVVLGEPKVQSDGKVSISEMINIINDTYDSKYLKNIIDTDGRPQIVAKAQDQLDKIKPKKGEKQDKNQEGVHEFTVK